MTQFSTADLPISRQIRINSETVTVPEGEDFLAFLRTQTRTRGITTFAAYVNRRELNSLDEISSEFNEGQLIEVKTYAKPGSN